MVKTITFPNGCRLVYENPHTSFRNTTIEILCKLGSVNEANGIYGASHFIEHMCFKGTKKIPQAKTITENYDKIGAYFNASTFKEHTSYYVKCFDDYVENSLHVLSDMILNSLFKKSEYEKERKVVQEESIRTNDHGEYITDNMMDAIIYKGTSYANPVDTLAYHTSKTNPLLHEDALAMYKSFYRPGNIVISIVSNLSFQTILGMVKTSYFMKPAKPFCTSDHAWKYRIDSFVEPQNEMQYSIARKPGISTAYVQIGFRTCSYYSPDIYAIDILSTILGKGMSSRMFVLLREQNGLTYKSGAASNQYGSMGSFVFYAETDPRKMLENGDNPGVLPLLVKMIHDLYKHGITQKELNDAKTHLQGSFSRYSENMSNICTYNAIKTAFLNVDDKSHVSYKDFYSTYYAKITRIQVNSIIKKYFKKSNGAVCILGDDVFPLKKVAHICKNLE
jgi:predicted Zn-dependent peptidase